MGSSDTTGKRRPYTKGTGYGTFDLGNSNEIYNLPFGGNEGDEWVIRALNSNNGTVYIGWDDSMDDTSGFPLYHGDTISVAMSTDTQSVYVYGTSPGDQIRYLLVK